MKKRTFKQALFNAKTALKNFDQWAKLHQQKIRKTATAVGLVSAAAFLSTGAYIEAKHELANHKFDQANTVTAETVAPTADVNQADQEELVSELREIVKEMDLTAEEIDQLRNEYGFPAEIFDQQPTTQNEPELTR